MRRYGRLVGGFGLLFLGLGPVVSAGKELRPLYLLVALGAALGGLANLFRRRRTNGVASWRHVANGAWLGGIVAPAVFVVALGGVYEAVAEVIGLSLVASFLVGYGSGLILSGLNALPDQTPSPTKSE